jgi:hypothetical protein
MNSVGAILDDLINAWFIIMRSFFLSFVNKKRIG